MLEKIKSKYILKFIVSNLKYKRKLKLFRINNKIRNILEIELIDYKILSERYIIGKKNGYAKEYNIFNDELIFEGDYIEGKKYGYGKEYINKRISFEGNYLNGKRNGKGVEYYSDGKSIKFRGIYLLGIKYSGRGYDNEGYTIYEIKDGKGYVKEFNEYGKCIFEGEYPNGIGKEYYLNNLGGTEIKFEGEYKNGIKWNGKGYDISGQLIYELKNGKGYIKEFYVTGVCYFEGEYINGKRNGKGKEYNYKGDIIFEGEYINGKRNGKGKEYNYYGNLIFEGEYINNYKRKGKEYIKGKLYFKGEYLFNKKWTGKTYDENGNIIYEINNGNGISREYLNDNLIFEGEYINGKRNGKGKQYSNNKLYFEGEFFDGNRLNGKEYNYKGNLIFEGKFKNKERWNGKSKEYDNKNNLIFEGEIKEGKRWNGKGKEYMSIMSNKLHISSLLLEHLKDKVKLKINLNQEKNKIIIFEGEYYKGKKWNGKFYEYLYNKIFEGEIYKGKKWNGKEIEYNSNYDLIYEANITNGKRLIVIDKRYKSEKNNNCFIY